MSPSHCPILTRNLRLLLFCRATQFELAAKEVAHEIFYHDSRVDIDDQGIQVTLDCHEANPTKIRQLTVSCKPCATCRVLVEIRDWKHPGSDP